MICKDCFDWTDALWIYADNMCVCVLFVAKLSHTMPEMRTINCVTDSDSIPATANPEAVSQLIVSINLTSTYN